MEQSVALPHQHSLQYLAGLFTVLIASTVWAEDGYRLWLRYERLTDPKHIQKYTHSITEIALPKAFEYDDVIRQELRTGLSGLLGTAVPFTDSITKNGAVAVGTYESSDVIKERVAPSKLKACGPEGYLIQSTRYNDHSITVIAGNTRAGLLYGMFHFLRLIQTAQSLDNLLIEQRPQIRKRLLNHWDNLDGSVERGYAGQSIWQWDTLPDNPNPRIKDYARANASIGMNGVVLNNVNSQAEILRTDYLRKASVIAGILRPYGIRIYFSVKFTSPREIGGLDTADPLNPEVVQWWKDKAAEIYRIIPKASPDRSNTAAVMLTGRICWQRHWPRLEGLSCGGPSCTICPLIRTAPSVPTWSSFLWMENLHPMCSFKPRTVRLIFSRGNRSIRCSAQCRKPR